MIKKFNNTALLRHKEKNSLNIAARIMNSHKPSLEGNLATSIKILNTHSTSRNLSYKNIGCI